MRHWCRAAPRLAKAAATAATRAGGARLPKKLGEARRRHESARASTTVRRGGRLTQWMGGGWRARCRGTFDLDSPPFDWGVDYRKPDIPFHDLVIYEAAVRGYTAHESSKLGPLAGTYLGVAAKIEHLKQLGINAIELLPVRRLTTRFSFLLWLSAWTRARASRPHGSR
jgi:hypothetical protein